MYFTENQLPVNIAPFINLNNIITLFLTEVVHSRTRF